MAGEHGENGDPLDEPLEEPDEEIEDGDEGERSAEPMHTLSPAGREAFVAVFAIEDWLDGAPGGALSLVEDDRAQAIVAAFIDGWSSGVSHALATRPLTIAELENRVEDLDREELEATVAAMRGAGLLSARPSDGEGARYAVTDWMREAVGPMVVAMRSEIRQAEVLAEEEAEAEGIDPDDIEIEIDATYEPRDVETAFLLALPLLELPAELSGTCRLVVELPESDEELAGATIRVEGGRIASCSIELEGDANAWILGPSLEWMDAMVEPGEDGDGLELGGELPLARRVLGGLRSRLFERQKE